jgi:hypothetical protein
MLYITNNPLTLLLIKKKICFSKPRAREEQEYTFHYVQLYSFSPAQPFHNTLFVLHPLELVLCTIFIHNNAQLCSYSP